MRIDRTALVDYERERRETDERVQWEMSKVRALRPDWDKKRIQEEASQVVGNQLTDEWNEREKARKAAAEHQEFRKKLDASLGK